MAQKSIVIDQALVEQYVNVTGTDEIVARNMLEACDGNLEVAINMYLEEGSGGPSANPQLLGETALENRTTSTAADDPTSTIQSGLYSTKEQQTASGSSSSSHNNRTDIIWYT